MKVLEYTAHMGRRAARTLLAAAMTAVMLAAAPLVPALAATDDTRDEARPIRTEPAPDAGAGSLPNGHLWMSTAPTGSIGAVVSADPAVTPRAAAKKRPRRPRRRIPFRTCTASWYGPGFYGHGMAGGGKLTRKSMVIAHKTLPFGTMIKVVWNGRSALAMVKDRGPFVAGREMDLGPGVMTKLRFSGAHKIRYQILRYGYAKLRSRR